jgi:hypothetical protein
MGCNDWWQDSRPAYVSVEDRIVAALRLTWSQFNEGPVRLAMETVRRCHDNGEGLYLAGDDFKAAMMTVAVSTVMSDPTRRRALRANGGPR